MYLPRPFAASGDAALLELVRGFPFATLISRRGSEREISHLPLVLEERGEEWVLLGHMARANPHSRLLAGDDALAIFQGPHAYVSPLWYARADVPTWNYVVAHLEGKASALETEAETLAALRALARAVEGEGGWPFTVPEDLRPAGALREAIVAFEIPVRRRTGKFKLSQNRSAEDVAGVLRGLGERADPQSRELKRWMERVLPAGKADPCRSP